MCFTNYRKDQNFELTFCGQYDKHLQHTFFAITQIPYVYANKYMYILVNIKIFSKNIADSFIVQMSTARTANIYIGRRIQVHA